MTASSELSSMFKQHFKRLEGDVWLVPCIADYEGNVFTPLFKPVSEQLEIPKAPSRKDWSQQEDDALKGIVDLRGSSSWTLVAKEINSIFHRGKPVRVPRKCRERWINHLNPNINKGSWTIHEDITLIELQLKYGNRWSDISKKLEGRTDNNVKNRWKSLVRDKRSLEEIEEILKTKKRILMLGDDCSDDSYIYSCKSGEPMSPLDLLR